MIMADQPDDTYEMNDPIATVILQTDGKSYELILAGGGGVIRKHELFGPFKSNKKKARSTMRLLWHIAYQTIQDELLGDIADD
jgi:hypothetical protein